MDTPLSIDYVAWEPSWGTIDGLTFEINRFDHLTDNASQSIPFQQIFEETPVVLADLQERGPGTVLGVCWDDKRADSVEVTITLSDAVTPEAARHNLVVGYIAVREIFLD